MVKTAIILYTLDGEIDGRLFASTLENIPSDASAAEIAILAEDVYNARPLKIYGDIKVVGVARDLGALERQGYAVHGVEQVPPQPIPTTYKATDWLKGVRT